MPPLRGKGSRGWSLEDSCSLPLVLPGSLQEGQAHGRQAEEIERAAGERTSPHASGNGQRAAAGGFDTVSKEARGLTF